MMMVIIFRKTSKRQQQHFESCSQYCDDGLLTHVCTVRQGFERFHSAQVGMFPLADKGKAG